MTRARSLAALLLGSSALLAGPALAQEAALPQADDPWFQAGAARLQEILALQPNTNRARNVILFVGDGLGVSTVTAARIFEGQLAGGQGEDHVLSFEAFPYAALVKTYSADGQVSDSAPTATAMHAGVKTNNGVLGVADVVAEQDCAAGLANPVTSILEIAEQRGLATGVVSTARITHATPAAAYSHTSFRDWEADNNMPAEVIAAGCTDIASQLVEFPIGDGLEVALGGGRQMFLPKEAADPEDPGQTGVRADGRDLTQLWVEGRNDAAFVWNLEQFEALDLANTNHLLGLFNRSHMQYEADRAGDAGGEPSLTDMTLAAIEVLSRDPEGFYLQVEGGRVDHASHAGNAYRTLTDAVELARAIEAASGVVDLSETLIIVTADHSHSLTINGYPERGNPILGLVEWQGELQLGADGKPYTTLGYANGPGAWATGAEGAPAVRPDLAGVDTTDPDYLQQATVPLGSETHTGEDVALYAAGPWAHLFQGTVEQNYIYHVMAHALGFPGSTAAAQ